MFAKKLTGGILLLALCIPSGLYAQKIPLKPKNPAAVIKQVSRGQAALSVKPGVTSNLTNAVTRQTVAAQTTLNRAALTPVPTAQTPSFVITEGLSRVPQGAGRTQAVAMSAPRDIIPLKTEDEVLVLPTDMQGLIGTMTQSAMDRFGKGLEDEKVNFVETLFRGVPTYSRLATASYLQTLGVDTETIVKAAGQFPSILKEYLPRVADSEPLLNYLYQNKRYSDETLPILLEHAQPEQINNFLTSSVWNLKFEEADDLIAHYGADINVAFQQISDGRFFYDEDLFAALQFFIDRNVDLNQVFDKAKYPTAPTIAHQIAYNGDFVAVPFLKEHGVNLNAPDANGDTPLHIAVKSPKGVGFVIFKSLIYDGGADPTIKNNDGLDVMQQIQVALSDPSLSSGREYDLQSMQELLKPQKKTKKK